MPAQEKSMINDFMFSKTVDMPIMHVNEIPVSDITISQYLH
jgi:hypothetical protein